MASADQLKALLKSHIEGDEAHFFSVDSRVIPRRPYLAGQK